MENYHKQRFGTRKMDNEFLKNNLDRLQVGIIYAAYTKCWRSWRELDFIPDYNKIYFICGGEGWVRVGGRDYYPSPGQMLLAPAGVTQSYSAVSDNTYVKYWCHFTAKIGDTNLFDLVDVPRLIDVADKTEVTELFEKMVSCHNSGSFSSNFAEKAALLDILGYYLESTASEMKPARNENASRLNDLTGYIHDNLSSAITVESLAEKYHLHPNYFIRYFKKATGASPMQYIYKARIEKAKLLLKSTGLSITEISDRTGFGDIYHFSRSFKNYTGYSPSDFRKI